jgi:ABC-type uncharacterized transport system substrate-binding protein
MKRMKRRLGPKALLLAAALTLGPPALAHPHVWVTAKAEVLYAPDGKVTGIRHAWTFDKGYSAFLTQGLDRNNDGKLTPDELKDLARENTESLVDFDYFTFVKVNGVKQAFDAPRDYGMTFANDEATLSYVLPLKTPAAGAKTLAVEIYDPTFFVGFGLAEGDDALKLAGAPTGCSAKVIRANAGTMTQQQNLSEAFFQALTPNSSFGAQFANRALVACP